MFMSNNNSSETNPINIPDANLTVSDKVDELRGRIKIHQDILSNNKGVIEETPKVKKALQEAEKAFTDFDWVIALKVSGASEEEILKVWQIKDEKAGKERDIRNRASLT